MEIQKTSNEFWIVGIKSRGNGTFIPINWTISYTRKDSMNKLFCEWRTIYDDDWKKFWRGQRGRGVTVRKVKLEFRE